VVHVVTVVEITRSKEIKKIKKSF